MENHRCFLQPGLDSGVNVGTVVIADKMYLQVHGTRMLIFVRNFLDSTCR